MQVKKKGGELEVGFGGLEKMFPETIGAEDAEPDSKFTVFMLFGTDEERVCAKQMIHALFDKVEDEKKEKREKDRQGSGPYTSTDQFIFNFQLKFELLIPETT